MKRLVMFLPGSILFLLSLAGCQKNVKVDYTDPQAVVEYQQNVICNIIARDMTSKRAYKKLNPVSSSKRQEKYPKKAYIELLSQYERYQEVDMIMVDYDLGEPIYDGDEIANILVIQHYKNGLTMERKICLIKEKDRWLIEEDKIIR
ncbi:MAG: hypothetical protein GX347_01210 [Epulopiscium sp.]|nr:hypothetical protein [Candidatus Epulonipiscium sp.]